MTVGGWILVAVLFIGGILTPYRVLLLFGVLYTLTLLTQKDVVVTKRGLEIYYQMRITTQYNFWGWDQILSVTREDKGHPEVVALYFGMENKAKRLYFTRPMAEKVLELAREAKPAFPSGKRRTPVPQAAQGAEHKSMGGWRPFDALASSAQGNDPCSYPHSGQLRVQRRPL